uniref:Uncharacterized protein n=1 Tax=viral metagenome TaxID=1070528 RepID=A0A6C0BSG8_9ZZZZ
MTQNMCYDKASVLVVYNSVKKFLQTKYVEHHISISISNNRNIYNQTLGKGLL